MPIPPRDEAIILAEIESLRTAMTSGTSSVEYEGRKVQYRSLTEMTRALSILERELGAANDEAAPIKRRYAEFHRGYRDSRADETEFEEP